MNKFQTATGISLRARDTDQLASQPPNQPPTPGMRRVVDMNIQHYILVYIYVEHILIGSIKSGKYTCNTYTAKNDDDATSLHPSILPPTHRRTQSERATENVRRLEIKLIKG